MAGQRRRAAEGGGIGVGDTRSRAAASQHSTAQRSAAQGDRLLRAVARVIVLINLPYLPYSGRLVCALQATILPYRPSWDWER